MEPVQTLEAQILELKARIQEFEKGVKADQIIRSIAVNSPSNIMLLDSDARIQYLNHTVPGITPEEMVGLCLFDIVEEQFRPGIRGALERVAKTGEPDRYETSYTSPSGDFSWWDSGVGPVIQDGKVTGFVVVSTNTTEQRRRTEEQERFFNLSVDMMCVVGFDGYFKRVNQAFKTTLGYETELLNRPFFEFLHPEDVKPTEEFVARIAAGDMKSEFSNRYRAANGSYRLLSWTGVPDYKLGVTYAVARDITDTKNLEEQLRASKARLVTAERVAQTGNWSYEVATEQIQWSDGMWPIYGLIPPPESISYQQLMTLVHPDDRAMHDEYMAALLVLTLESPEVARFEYRLIRPDGIERTVEVYCQPEFDLRGQPARMFGTVHDITERKQLEQKFLQSQRMEAIGTLAGGIAHDFNNILAGIVGYNALAQRAAAGNEKLLDYLGEIGRAGDRATDLVRQILAFSRADGQHVLPLQLRHIMVEAVQLLRAAIPASIIFDVKLGSNLPAVLGNATQLHQVIMNLGTNAWHAMREQREGQLSVTLDACDVDEMLASELQDIKAGPFVRISVSDTGCGMDTLVKARVFEPFFTTKAAGEGSGLGLSVVHGIVRSHNGAIRLTSVVAEGSTFEIFLPSITLSPQQANADPRLIQRGHGQRILFVDDEPQIVRIAEHMLGQCGYTVTGETRVLEALAMLERDPARFDLVITDQTMPGLTGLEFITCIRRLRSDLPVVLVSGFSSALTPERVLAAGVHEILAKPYSMTQLTEAVYRHLYSTCC
jgi:PAS domain S-box-containing protein